MDTDWAIRLLACIICTCLTYFSVYNLCKYFHVDEKEVVDRLVAVKNHDFRGKTPTVANGFTLTRSNFRFRIFSKIFKNIKFSDKIKTMLERADIPWQVDTFFIFSVFLGLIPLIFGLLIFPAFAILCPFMLVAPIIHVNLKIKKRVLAFTQQLPDALDLLCNALRAGHSLFSAFNVIVNEMPNPINRIFKILTDEIALGIDAKDAMKSVQEIVPQSVDFRFFTTVVILQREIGGNLIKLLEILAATIRERFKMIGQIKAQTMQAKLSGIIVSVIPPIICVVLFIMAPDYMKYLTNHIYGKIALGVSAVLMIIGFFAIKKITDIDV